MMRADGVLDLDREAACRHRIRNDVLHGAGRCRAHDSTDSILDVPSGMAVCRVFGAVIPERRNPEDGVCRITRFDGHRQGEHARHGGR